MEVREIRPVSNQIQIERPKKPKTTELITTISLSQDRIAIASAMVELAERAEKNELLQKALKKIELPPPFDIFGYRKGESGRRGGWYKKPNWMYERSPAQLYQQWKLSAIAYRLWGQKGNVVREDGTRIATINHMIGEELRGVKVISDVEKHERNRQRTIERIAQV